MPSLMWEHTLVTVRIDFRAANALRKNTINRQNGIGLHVDNVLFLEV